MIANFNNQLIDCLQQPALIMNLSAEILYCNFLFKKLYNLDSEDYGQNYINLSKPFYKNEITIQDLCDESCLKISTHPIIRVNQDATYSWTSSLLSDGKKPIAILLIGTDISSVIRHFDQEQMIHSSLLDLLPAQIFWKSKDLVYLGCNEAFVQSLHLASKAEVIGKTDFDLPVNIENSIMYRADDMHVIESKKPKLAIEESQILADGTERILSTNKVPIFDTDNNVFGVLAIYIDVTELRTAEAKARKAETNEAAARAKAEAEEEMRKTVMVLVGDIVHDLRTPIATIRTVTGLMEGILPILLEIIEEARGLGASKIGLLRKPKWEYLQNNTPIKSLNHAVRMMDDFINTTLKELSNAQKYPHIVFTDDDLTVCSSRRILENTLDAFPFPSSIKIHQNTSYDFSLKGNSILIMKIIFNLLRNSVEQIHANGKGEIFISTELAGHLNVLKIKDTAGGVSPEVLANLFQPYFTTKHNGTGIGLSFSKKTMRDFGGDLTCHSKYGEYIEFVLSFPMI